MNSIPNLLPHDSLHLYVNFIICLILSVSDETCEIQNYVLKSDNQRICRNNNDFCYIFYFSNLTSQWITHGY
jgi:hypothetical protein